MLAVRFTVAAWCENLEYVLNLINIIFNKEIWGYNTEMGCDFFLLGKLGL